MADYVIEPDDELGKALDALQGQWKTVRLALHYALTDGNPDGVRNLLANGAHCEAAVERFKIGHARPECEPAEKDGWVMQELKAAARRSLERREKHAKALDAAGDVIRPDFPLHQPKGT